MASLSADEELAEMLAGFYADPMGHVIFSYPWDTEKSIQLVDWHSEDLKALIPVENNDKGASVWDLMEPYRKRFPNVRFGPDWWACDFLDEVGREVKKRGFDGRKAVAPIQMATLSGHGIGKSVIVAWLIKWILDTRPLSKGIVTAGTADQLRTKTWAEVGKWHKMSLTSHWFDYSSGRGSMSLAANRTDARGQTLKEQWRCDAQTCREENSDAFAGLHAANATPFYIFDEGSAVPDKIYEVREGGTTDGEPMTFDFGNPVRNSGRLFEEAEGKLRHRYIVRHIDSRTVQITNKERIQQWIDDFGEDSDFVKVRVRGRFPSAGSLQFIPTADVEEAMSRPLFLDRSAPLIIGVDVARFGDDESVIYPRLGKDARSWAPLPGKGRYRGLDTVQLVGKVIETVRNFRQLGKQVSALFVDGGGVGGGVVDQLRNLGYNPIEVQFGGGATDKMTYRYKSDEMWGNLRDDLKSGLILPDERHETGGVLKEQLTQREYGYTKQGNKVHLEAKEDMKKRLGGDFASPDVADALACTYAQEVVALADTFAGQPLFAQHEYDPQVDKVT